MSEGWEAQGWIDLKIEKTVLDSPPNTHTRTRTGISALTHTHTHAHRFPHRNKILGRDSTPEEVAWLNSAERPGWASSQECSVFRYWDGRGMGDQVRFVLEFAGHPYDEVNLTTRHQFVSWGLTNTIVAHD